MARRSPPPAEGSASPHELDLEALPREESGVVLWDEVFGASRPLRMEIGVGNSTFLIELAKQDPGFNYLGFEYSWKRVLKFLKKVQAEGIDRIRMLRINAARILSTACAPSSVDHFYLNHPDPWPKRRHAKRRFVTPENATVMVRLLRPGGGISLRTDHAAYAQQMLDVLDAAEGLENLAGKGRFAPEPIVSARTPYESKFLSAGLRIYYLEHRKSVG
ncbi:MAG: tRNA (guanosine(46)-N7)-methyltransferase TrmB [Planctomycetes bacterium]|nr:tRNA (guanosine(46)-N7)-methyltransferase TrmB [Planctomycetota bacterium]